jgi:uncharacterized membrane protein
LIIRKNHLIVFFFTLCCIILLFLPTGFEGSRAGDAYLEKAKVLTVDNGDLRRNLIVQTGTQDLQVKIVSGPHRGENARVVNPLSGKLEFDEIYKPGDTILVEYKRHEGGIRMAYTRGYYRLGHETILVAIFCVFLVSIAGMTGVKALLSFAFAGLMIWKVLIPLFLKDISPIPVALFVVAMLTASVSFLVGGWTRKGATAFLGSFAGLLMACLLAVFLSPGFHLNGAVRPFAENLLYAGFPHLDLKDVFLAGIFLACSGAVMDLSMDIAASMDEVKNKRPEIGFRELLRSGLAVGKSVVGTMTTTLLLAYSGGYTAMMMNFMGQGLQMRQILNMNFVASEILNVFVGSFGLVAVAPFTAIVGAVLYGRKGSAGNNTNLTVF